MAGRIRSPLRAVRNLFLTGLDPASLAGMAAAVAVAGEYPPPGAGGGPPEFLTGPPGQGPPAPTGGSPGEFLAPSGKRGRYPRQSYFHRKTDRIATADLPQSCRACPRANFMFALSHRYISVIFVMLNGDAAINSRSALRKLKKFFFLHEKNNIPHESFL